MKRVSPAFPYKRIATQPRAHWATGRSANLTPIVGPVRQITRQRRCAPPLRVNQYEHIRHRLVPIEHQPRAGMRNVNDRAVSRLATLSNELGGVLELTTRLFAQLGRGADNFR